MLKPKTEAYKKFMSYILEEEKTRGKGHHMIMVGDPSKKQMVQHNEDALYNLSPTSRAKALNVRQDVKVTPRVFLREGTDGSVINDKNQMRAIEEEIS